MDRCPPEGKGTGANATRLVAAVLLLSLLAGPVAPARGGTRVNDVHSGLNETRVRRVARPATVEAVQALVRRARQEGVAISITGGRHAMGGQQFGAGTLLIDMSRMDRVLGLDRAAGIVEVEAGIRWPALTDQLVRAQPPGDGPAAWGIIQKQTGADSLSIGGALSANVHGRGLRFKPIIGDVESFVLVDAEGRLRTCSRSENPELFRLAIGGYGLFGVIATVRLRLMPRTKVERVVTLLNVDDLAAAIEARVRDGFLYGDLQFSTDDASDDFLRKGVFSCYRPVPATAPIDERPRSLSEDDWSSLYELSHVNRAKAFAVYSRHYLATSGQIYWSDTHQLSTYLEGYHKALDRRLRSPVPGSEMISELYVPRPALAEFMGRVRDDFRRHRVPLIYGTIRFIEKDDESFLPWARERFACIVFNLHVDHSPEGLSRAADDFRRLIDRAIELGGSYFLTYHRWATRGQLEACYPKFREFLALKRKYDPEERFQSDWYRHYRTMFAEASTRQSAEAAPR
jgi:FAD/FMN-containing dehydrogenase